MASSNPSQDDIGASSNYPQDDDGASSRFPQDDGASSNSSSCSDTSASHLLACNSNASQDDHGASSSSAEDDNAGDVEDYSKYLPLYKASLQGNWEEAQKFFNHDNNAIQARLNFQLQTALHVAVGANNAASFVAKLVAMMPDEALGLKDCYGQTPLHIAALYGNIEAAKIIVGRNYNLLYYRNNYSFLPIDCAAIETCNKDSLLYFFHVTKDDHLPNPYAGASGVALLCRLIESKFFDVALDLVEKHPDLARQLSETEHSALWALVMHEYTVINKGHLSIWQRLYILWSTWRHYLNGPNNGDIENVGEETQNNILSCCPLPSILEVLQLKSIINNMQMHQKAVRLLECLCEKLKTLNDAQVLSIAKTAIILAARLDICEVVVNIVEAHPSATYYVECRKNILLIAVENRCENVFTLVYRMSERKHDLQHSTDPNENNILHLAGKLAPTHKLNLVSGAALQMQGELQWFKEVQKVARSSFKSLRNKYGQTPIMVFTEVHKDLKVEGEKWIRDTSYSCTIAATLIVTVVFADAITVPGGNNDENGLPIFSKKYAFKIFAISNAASLFTSATSLLVFLSILTSRYVERDFLYTLPRRLIIGLLTLFLSIIFMMVFSATVFLVFCHNKAWVLIIVAALACLPVTSFVLLQFPLLIDLVSSAPGIFNKLGYDRQILF